MGAEVLTKFFFEAQGFKEVEVKFDRAATAAMDASPAMHAVADYMMGVEAEVFNSEGARGGTPWAPITFYWLTRKWREGLDLRIGHATLFLRNSLTWRGAYGQILEVGPHSLRFGSAFRYAGTQQAHRPFMQLLPEDKIHIRSIIRSYLMAAFGAPAKGVSTLSFTNTGIKAFGGGTVLRGGGGRFVKVVK
jgi:phage gpG-like protein